MLGRYRTHTHGKTIKWTNFCPQPYAKENEVTERVDEEEREELRAEEKMERGVMSGKKQSETGKYDQRATRHFDITMDRTCSRPISPTPTFGTVK